MACVYAICLRLYNATDADDKEIASVTETQYDAHVMGVFSSRKGAEDAIASNAKLFIDVHPKIIAFHVSDNSPGTPIHVITGGYGLIPFLSDNLSFVEDMINYMNVECYPEIMKVDDEFNLYSSYTNLPDIYTEGVLSGPNSYVKITKNRSYQPLVEEKIRQQKRLDDAKKKIDNIDIRLHSL